MMAARRAARLERRRWPVWLAALLWLRLDARLLVGLAALLLLFATPLAPGTGPHAAWAQTPRGASPYLPHDHWSADAARRLHALGLTPADFDPGLRTRPVAEVRALLNGARERAGDVHPITPLIARWQERLAAEYGGTPGAPPDADITAATIAAGAAHDRGRPRAGVGFLFGDWTGARPGPEHSGPALWTALYGSRGDAAGASVAGAVSLRALPSEVEVEEAYAVAGWRGVGFWAGRRTVGYGPGGGGALVLNGDLPMTGFGGQLNRGYSLPGFLRVLGPVRLEGFFSRVDNVQKPEGGTDRVFSPWFGAARISGSPFHRRLTLSASRGAMFGGEGNAPITLRNFVTMLYGNHAGVQGEFHTEVFAFDASYRPPVPVPLLLRLEWGVDDGAGMIHRAPAMVWAVELGALPGVPQASLGFERTLFSGCHGCRNTLWYRNWSFRGGWSDDGVALGHPLGGHGREHRIHGRFDAASAPVQLGAELRLRKRRAENLFAPEREGASTLLGIRAHWQPRGRLLLDASASHEWGERDWRSTVIEARAGYRF